MVFKGFSTGVVAEADTYSPEERYDHNVQNPMVKMLKDLLFVIICMGVFVLFIYLMMTANGSDEEQIKKVVIAVSVICGGLVLIIFITSGPKTYKAHKEKAEYWKSQPRAYDTTYDKKRSGLYKLFKTMIFAGISVAVAAFFVAVNLSDNGSDYSWVWYIVGTVALISAIAGLISIAVYVVNYDEKADVIKYSIKTTFKGGADEITVTYKDGSDASEDCVISEQYSMHMDGDGPIGYRPSLLYCPLCEKQVKPADIFCKNCGKKLR